MARARNRWGWGFEDAAIGSAEASAAAPGVVALLGFGSTEVAEPAPEPSLPAPRVEPPAGVAAICSADDHDRACHSLGKSYVDAIRGLRGDYAHVVDLVARPGDEPEIEAV